MLTYCVKCRTKTKNLNPKIFTTKNGGLIMQSKCTECGIKRSKFVKEQEAKGLLSNLGIKRNCKFLLAGDKFMHEMHLKQLGFT